MSIARTIRTDIATLVCSLLAWRAANLSGVRRTVTGTADCGAASRASAFRQQPLRIIRSSQPPWNGCGKGFSAKPRQVRDEQSELLERNSTMRREWYPVSVALRDGTPIILWLEDPDAPPVYPVTVGVWETDDMTGTSYWRVFGAIYGTRVYFDDHVRGWMPLPHLHHA
jgi:hypothetical protein